MNHYKQDKYILSASDFTIDKMEQLVEEIWSNRDTIKHELTNQQDAIVDEIVSVGRKVFTNENDK